MEKKKCQICKQVETPGDFISPYELLNGSTLFVCKGCLSIPLLESLFDEGGLNEDIDLDMASKVLKDLLKRRKIQGGDSIAPYYRKSRRDYSERRRN